MNTDGNQVGVRIGKHKLKPLIMYRDYVYSYNSYFIFSIWRYSYFISIKREAPRFVMRAHLRLTCG